MGLNHCTGMLVRFDEGVFIKFTWMSNIKTF